MAADIDLLERAEIGETGFRVYGWDGVWVSLGMNQAPLDTLVDAEATNWVLRPTGGAAVLHGHDVTVSIAMPLATRIDTYRTVTSPLVAALNALGIPAMLAEDLGEARAYKSRPDCFATTTKNDIIHRETLQKICGCALRRTRAAVLLQASIPVAPPLVDSSTVIRGGVRTAVTCVEPEALRHELGARLKATQG